MQLHAAWVCVRDLTTAQVLCEHVLELPLQAGRAEGGFCVSGDGS